MQIHLQRQEKSFQIQQDTSSEINGLKSQNMELQSMLKVLRDEIQEMKKSYEQELRNIKNERQNEEDAMNEARKEISKSEEYYRKELMEKEKISAALRNELERRLEELKKEKTENSALQSENAKILKQLEDISS